MMMMDAPAAGVAAFAATAPDASAPPRVTFGVPVRNGAPHIEQCLRALLSQTLPGIEILVSDNASTDATEEICRRYAADPRVRYFRQPEDIGMVGNFMFVAEHARGRYFAWRAHDDLSLPDYAEKLSKLLDEHPHCQLAVGRIHWDDQANRFFRSYKHPDTSHDRPVVRVAKQMVRFTPHWCYGLYRRETAIAYMRYALEHIGVTTFHNDVIAMSRMLASGKVISAPVTVFVGRRVSLGTFDYAAVSRSDLLLAVRSYWSAIRSGMSEANWTLWEKAIIYVFAAYNMNRRHVRLKWLMRKNHFAR